MAEPLDIAGPLVIPASDLTVATSRASGPGGQHVNKTETRVQLRFALATCEALSEDVKARVRATKEGLLTVEGDLLLSCERFRSRDRNLKAARARLAGLIRRCLRPPTPRKPTKPTRASKRRRVDAKRRRSDIKHGRKKVDF